MEDMLDIGDVTRRTGLTLRALRFYEGRGLVSPLRTAGGRRIYGAGDLARLNAIVALKHAGFSLTEIAAMLRSGAIGPHPQAVAPLGGLARANPESRYG